MERSSAFESQVVRVLDTDGIPLTAAKTRAVEDDGAVRLAEVEDQSVLIDYYFGRGERFVVMDLHDQTVEGTLETWWLGGERVWQVYVDRPLVMLGPVGSAEPEPAGSRP
jgi:hypothetical protein